MSESFSVKPSQSRQPATPAIVGRKRERQYVCDWLSASDSQTGIVWISGMGGIGKTTLMTDMAIAARKAGARTIWLNGRVNARIPADLLTSIEMILESEYGVIRPTHQPLLTHIAQQLSDQRTLLFFDNAETLNNIESWLMGNFLPQLSPTEVLVVIAARGSVPVSWSLHQTWGSRLHHMPLKVFTGAEIREYLHTLTLPNATIERIGRETQGHPLSMALAARAVDRTGQMPTSLTRITSETLSAQLLEEVISPELFGPLQALSMLPWANQDDLSQLSGISLDAAQYHALGSLSFVQSGPQGLSLHDVVYRFVRQDWGHRDERGYWKTAQKALSILAARYPTEGLAEQMQIAAFVLDLFSELRPAHAYARFSHMPSKHVHKPFCQDDLPQLHRFLADALDGGAWQSESIASGQHHALLDTIAARFPESILIIRDENGTPLSFLAALWLHQESMPILQEFAPIVLRLLAEEAPPLSRLPVEYQDSMIVLLAAVDTSHTAYGPDELGAWQLQEALTLMSIGYRSIVVSGDEALNQLLQAFGFQRRSNPPGSQCPEVLELDFRSRAFPHWVKALMQSMGDDSQISEPGPFLARDVSASEMGELLKCLDDVKALGDSPLACHYGIDGMTMQRIIWTLLSVDPPPFPLSPIQQQMLRESFLNVGKTRSQIADQFHISRATLYRQTRQAYKNMAQALLHALLNQVSHSQK